MYKFEVTNLSKRYGRLKLFDNISFSLSTGDSMAITGPNGSGKSTMAKIFLKTVIPNKGKMNFSHNDKELDTDVQRILTAFVSPYLNYYAPLTAEENILFFASISGINITGKEINVLLEKVGLEGRGMDTLSTYSSGMLQRLKYIIALIKKPALMIIDEPTANLDESGKIIVRNIIEELRGKCILIIATNEKEEYNLAGRELSLA